MRRMSRSGEDRKEKGPKKEMKSEKRGIFNDVRRPIDSNGNRKEGWIAKSYLD